ncbi:MAG: efflux RND transporter periplasmic adaptor subunit [Deltaproteobacteria bacterium]|nr:efflux RND transporter periplasmic adaptor subunit [Deltaproteobacteria bacterium]
MKKYWKHCLVSTIILVLILVITQFVLSRHSEPDLQLATAAVASFDININTIGALDTERSHIVSSAIKGDKGKIIFLVDDGAIVKKGDDLVRFDPTQFENEILRLTGELKSREAVVDARKQVLAWEKSQAEGMIRNAEFDMQDAKREYSRYISYVTDLEDLGKKGFHYPNEITQGKKKAEQLHNKLQKGETTLDQVQKEAVFKIAAAAAELGKAQIELETCRAALIDARSELNKSVVRAPFPGIVVHYEMFRDNLKRKPRVGDTVWQNQPLLYLPDISAMIVHTQVREVDLHKISKGQNTTIQVDAYPDIRFAGTVTAIGVLATDNLEGGRGEKYFQVTVAMSGEDVRLRPGMTARVYIHTDAVKNVLTVPTYAVFNDGGQKVCYIHQGSGLIKRDVKVGRQNEDVIEIVSGLRNGDRISLIKPATP